MLGSQHQSTSSMCVPFVLFVGSARNSRSHSDYHSQLVFVAPAAIASPKLFSLCRFFFSFFFAFLLFCFSFFVFSCRGSSVCLFVGLFSSNAVCDCERAAGSAEFGRQQSNNNNSSNEHTNVSVALHPLSSANINIFSEMIINSLERIKSTKANNGHKNVTKQLRQRQRNRQKDE